MSEELELINKYLTEVSNCINKMSIVPIYRAIDLIKQTRTNGRYIYTFGNGGSGSTASHLASDLSKGCGCRAFCLNDSIPLLTAYGNDNGYEHIFELQLDNIIEDKDLAIAISGSGNSINIINGIRMAKFKRAKTIGITGFNGGKLKELVDIPIMISVNNMEQIEDIHLMICHIIKVGLRLNFQ